MVVKQSVKIDKCMWSPIFPKSNRLMLVDSCPLAGQVKSQFWSSLERYEMRVGIQNAGVSQIIANRHYLTRKKKKDCSILLSETSLKAANERESSEIFFLFHPPQTDCLGRLHQQIKWPKGSLHGWSRKNDDTVCTWISKFGLVFSFSYIYSTHI